MAMPKEIGQGDDQRNTLRALNERPGIFELFPIPEEVEEDQTQAPTTPTRPRLTKEQREAMARKLNGKLRTASEAIVAKRKNEKALRGQIKDASECKAQKREVDEAEDSSSPQAKRKRPQGSSERPPQGTYCDPRLSKTAPIYHDVVAGDRVLVNAIARDPCIPEVDLCACRNSASPTYFTDGNGRIRSSYQQHLDRRNRRLLKLVARRLKKCQRGQPD
ncbi:Hypp1186 [Branchiostoma lanceolatum]|uniref:Hypp1186 protein n=1 Tax=Branchiostoma lanceolatum TaxID=7740 RepID=A0A8K0EHK2_BRALA|nr:Hypp1186 [Branchiostoma lanceolatum]